jgi:hypothetical protein
MERVGAVQRTNHSGPGVHPTCYLVDNGSSVPGSDAAGA